MLANSRKSLILIVDDTPANLEILSKALKESGFIVAVETDGEGALEQVSYHRPDLILLDVQMPGIDGFETCRRLKANPETKDIPIIFATALNDTSHKVKGLTVGAVDYVTKPFQQEEVLARVKVHLQLYQLQQELEQRVEERTASLQQALDNLKQAQLQLVQGEKMSALGNLVAGVAHEINNPVGFLKGNIPPAQEYVRDLFGLIDFLLTKLPHPDEEVEEEMEAIDFGFIREDLPNLLNSMNVGVDRIKSISTSLRTFSREDQDYKTAFNLHEGIDSTILILKHRLKANNKRPAIEVIKDYGNLPNVECFPGQINQVFMNILANAIDALDDSCEGRTFAEIETKPNQITIQTLPQGDYALICIRDNGVGIPEEVSQQIFEQGFTTKKVGKGTGLGMAIARQIVEQKHGGKLSFASKPGAGTAFTIELPLASDLDQSTSYYTDTMIA